jgi:pimeloyl-ACP methyl ester carboxylesterase
VHGLFVNSDHWRRTLIGLGGGVGDDNDNKDVRVYALDLLGCGWSSKPSRDDPMAMLANGENGRFLDCDTVSYRESNEGAGSRGVGVSGRRTSSVLENVPLGTPYGGHRLASRLELRHPLNSPYNFYTWSEQLADFTRDVILANDGRCDDDDKRRVTLVANSIGTMSSLQSMIDEPDLYNGVLVVNPNFRELHMAELPLSSVFMPLVRIVQRTLRENGAGLFQSLARPDIVRRILREPYSVLDAIDDELVRVLLDPLLTPGADDVVFDTLSYSAGPLPEQQLGSDHFPRDRPVWVVYGKDDPWTPSGRVENLGRTCGPVVERIVGLEGAGHCPHDEKPEEVNRLILEFLDRLENR